MIRVKATYEGLAGQTTSTGWKINNLVSFVALPSVRAQHKHVKIINPLNGKTTIAEVLDTGPWSEIDDDYVFNGARPLAERKLKWLYGEKFSEPCPQSNGAGIDLGKKVWDKLEMKGNTEVDWEFI